MKRIVVLGFGVAAACCGLQALALDLDPRLRAKAVAEGAAVPAPTRAALPELTGGVDSLGREFSGACSATSHEVCYDNRNGRIVYRGSRHWMPQFSGMRAEHISVRRDKIILHYSFR